MASTARMTTPISNDQELVVALRKKADEDFFFFATEVAELGLNPEPDGPRITEDQHELAQWLQNIYEKKSKSEMQNWLHIILTPRDTLKSTVLQAFALWIAIKNPNVRMLFYSEVHEQAKKRLAVIKRIVEKGKTFRLCYGDLTGSVKGYPWNDELITLSNRETQGVREGTIETAGLDVVVNSRHFDWIFPDDLHSERNTKTKDQIEGVRDKTRLLIPLLSKDGQMILAGVFWTDNDVHNWLIDEKHADVYKQSVYVDAAETISRYPNALPIPILQKKKDFLTTDVFSGQYLLDPTSKESQRFKKEWFALIPDKEFTSTRTFLLIDPAGDPTATSERRKDSDYYGMIVVGVNGLRDILLRQMFMEHASPTEAVEMALSLIFRYKPYVIGIEKVGLGNMKHYLAEELRKRGRFAIIEDLNPANRSKYSRVMELEPLARRRKIYIAENSLYKDEFLEQITKVTNGLKAKHDDLIDPLAYLLDLLKVYGGIEQDELENKIPPELAHLDSVSRDYWMSVRRAEQKKQNQNWVSEFNG